ncbi:hypothetical protein N9V13_03700 [Betaproteobacteria bacterium]|nr:hypothetical protein [Betaproteobacteria bacterium]
MKELNLYGFRILGIDTFWKRRASFKKRLIVIVGELTEEELYLVNSICFSINFNYGERQTIIVKSLPKWVKKGDTIVDFDGSVPTAGNIIRLPHPRKILQDSILKKNIWNDLSKFLKRNYD